MGKRKNDRVTIIILNWNGKDFLEENLESVLSLDYRNYKVLIVDNASDGGDIDYLKAIKKESSKVKLIINKENLGFAEGNNRGIEKVLEESKTLKKG